MSSPPPYLSTLQDGPYAQSRIGIVTLATPNSMFVNVGGTVMEVAFDVPFTTGTVVPPAAGTIVHLIRQDASWIAVGRVVGAGSNSVANPSFEESLPGAQPAKWFSYDVSGSSVAVVVDITGAPDGDFAARVSSAQTSVHYLYSSPIPVTVGDIWSLSVFVGGDYNGGAETADANLDAMWFANDTNLFPTVSSASITAASTVDVPQYPPFRSLAGSVTAPVTGFMRVAMKSTLVAGQALVYDSVIARKV